MSNCAKDLYNGIVDKNGVLNEFSRSVDVAVLESEQLISPKDVDSHIINLDGIQIDFPTFINLFYSKDGITFDINETKLDSTELSVKHRTIEGNLFNLVDSTLQLYSLDLGINTKQMDPCSLIEITNQLNYYRSLGHLCSVRCSLSLNQVIETILNKTQQSVTDWKDVVGDSATNKKVYHVLVINVRLFNANPAVKDIIIKFNYVVEFKGEQRLLDILSENSQYNGNITPTISLPDPKSFTDGNLVVTSTPVNIDGNVYIVNKISLKFSEEKNLLSNTITTSNMIKDNIYENVYGTFGPPSSVLITSFPNLTYDTYFSVGNNAPTFPSGDPQWPSLTDVVWFATGVTASVNIETQILQLTMKQGSTGNITYTYGDDSQNDYFTIDLTIVDGFIQK